MYDANLDEIGLRVALNEAPLSHHVQKSIKGVIGMSGMQRWHTLTRPTRPGQILRKYEEKLKEYDRKQIYVPKTEKVS